MIKVIERARYEVHAAGPATRAHAIVEIEGVHFQSRVPRTQTECDIINSALQQIENGTIK